MTYVVYKDWYAEIVARACVRGAWQEGLADGCFAWDLSNITSDTIVKEAWDRIDARDRGESYTKSAKAPHIAAREEWTGTFRWRCLQNGLRVDRYGPTATIFSIGASFVGDVAFRKLAEDSGLDKLPVKYRLLGAIGKVGEIPIYHAEVEEVPLLSRNAAWIDRVTRWVRHPYWKERLDPAPKQVYIVGRLDIPVKPLPIERVVDTIRKAEILAKKVEADRERADAEARQRKIDEDDAMARSIAAQTTPEDVDALSEAFG